MVVRLKLVGLFVLAALPVAAVDDIEERFAARGPFETHADLSTGPSNEFSLFRPAHQGEGGIKHPVITWGNGTFAVPLFYFDFLDHLASHGFVVIASHGLFVGSGKKMLDGVDWVVEQSKDPASPLHDSIDVGAIGASGHSQGGAGAIHAGSDPRIACTAPIEPTPGRVKELVGPMFVVAGQNDFVVPAWLVAWTVYAPSPVPSIFGILSGATHFDALGDAGGFRGYLTAWFAACLRGDSTAIRAFVGACSLCRNEAWFILRKRGTGYR